MNAITLYYKEGSSDKVYRAEIVPVGELFNVTFAYGRRGSTMTAGTKNNQPITFDVANKIHRKLVMEKKAKGYTEGEDGAAYGGVENEERFTGILPMLLNPIGEEDLVPYLNDDSWIAQEKHDGRRMILRKNADGTVDAINRKGLICGAPQVILDAARALPDGAVIDGECVGEVFYAFDYVAEFDLFERMMRLQKALKNVGMPIIETMSVQFHQKALFLDNLRERGAEGIVFKNIHGMYRPGRPSSGGNAVKFKFYATASVVVIAVNTQRSVMMCVLNGDKWDFVGNVAIPPNHKMPKQGDVIEVRYLYAYPNGSIYQPIYLGVRDDVDPSCCVASQLKYKSPQEEDEK